jgi:hypothetical protein
MNGHSGDRNAPNPNNTLTNTTSPPIIEQFGLRHVFTPSRLPGEPKPLAS